MTVADWESSHALIDEDYEEMTKFGITRSAADYFYYKEFRYTQLADAIAEAKRDESRERLRYGDVRAEARLIRRPS